MLNLWFNCDYHSVSMTNLPRSLCQISNLVRVALIVFLVCIEGVAPHPHSVVEGHDGAGRHVPPREQTLLRTLLDL